MPSAVLMAICSSKDSHHEPEAGKWRIDAAAGGDECGDGDDERRIGGACQVGALFFGRPNTETKRPNCGQYADSGGQVSH